MIYLKAVLLAVVEGLTEFLPVSSTGHLILVDAVISLSDDANFNVLFMMLIQLPAVLAVVLYFRDDLQPFGVEKSKRAANLRLWSKVLIAFVPAAALGVLVKDYIDARLFAPAPVSLALLVGGIVLVVIERGDRTVTASSVDQIGPRTALGIGLFQCFALIPGTSRSAATIIGAMLLGTSRAAAAEFSFLLAIPTMIGVAVYTIFDKGISITAHQWGVVALGSLVSFGVAYAAVTAFMSYIKRHSFALFGYYRIVLAAVVMAALASGWLPA